MRPAAARPDTAPIKGPLAKFEAGQELGARPVARSCGPPAEQLVLALPVQRERDLLRLAGEGDPVRARVEAGDLERALRRDRPLLLRGDAGGDAVELERRQRAPSGVVRPHEAEDENLDAIDRTARRGRARDGPGRGRAVAEPVPSNLLPVVVSSAAAACEDEGSDQQRFGPEGARKGALRGE